MSAVTIAFFVGCFALIVALERNSAAIRRRSAGMRELAAELERCRHANDDRHTDMMQKLLDLNISLLTATANGDFPRSSGVTA